jgi:hypothetical protein
MVSITELAPTADDSPFGSTLLDALLTPQENTLKLLIFLTSIFDTLLDDENISSPRVTSNPLLYENKSVVVHSDHNTEMRTDRRSTEI